MKSLTFLMISGLFIFSAFGSDLISDSKVAQPKVGIETEEAVSTFTALMEEAQLDQDLGGRCYVQCFPCCYVQPRCQKICTD